MHCSGRNKIFILGLWIRDARYSILDTGNWILVGHVFFAYRILPILCLTYKDPLRMIVLAPDFCIFI